MAVRYYDEALYDKLKAWLPDSLGAYILKPDETARLFKLEADAKKDEPLTLPLIALSRDPNIELLETTKSPLSFDGRRIDSREKDTIELNGIPISINYQIDIYTKHYEEGDTILRELLFKFLNNPKLKVVLPYNGINLEHYAYTRLSPTVTDNSDIPERLVEGEFTRWTIQLEIKDAYLFSVPVRKNWRVTEASLELVEGNYEIIEEKIDLDAKLND